LPSGRAFTLWVIVSFWRRTPSNSHNSCNLTSLFCWLCPQREGYLWVTSQSDTQARFYSLLLESKFVSNHLTMLYGFIIPLEFELAAACSFIVTTIVSFWRVGHFMAEITTLFLCWFGPVGKDFTFCITFGDNFFAWTKM